MKRSDSEILGNRAHYRGQKMGKHPNINRCLRSFLSIQECLRNLAAARNSRLGSVDSKHFVLELAGDCEERIVPSLGEAANCHFKDVDGVCWEIMGFYRAENEESGSRVFVESKRELTREEAELCRRKRVEVPRVYWYQYRDSDYRNQFI